MKFALTLILLIPIFATKAQSQWVSDSTVNTPVCTAANTQRNPKACSDGSNGVLIVWEDFRNGHDWDIYAQKLDANGVKQWKTNGVLACSSSNNQNNPIIASDDSGGAYIVWEDNVGSNDIDLYGQHILSDGSLGYSSSGAAIASADGNQEHAAITDDGKGNAFVAWEDNRTLIYFSTRPNIWMNKLSPGGALWGTDGTEVIDQDGKQLNPRLISDGNDGCLLAWENDGSQPFSICASAISADGTVQWPSIGNHTGKTIYGGMSGNNSRNVNITRDGNQYLFAWEEYDSYNSTRGWNILAQRIGSDGSFIWGGASAASDISTDYPGDQINPTVFSDDSTASFTGGGTAKGLMVVYENYLSSKDIVLTRLLGDGSTLKPSSPNQMFTVCRQSNNQQNPKAVKSGSGEILVAWEDQRSPVTGSTGTSIYAQRIDKTPKRLIGPSPSISSWGQAISNRSGVTCDELNLVPRTNGGIAVWRDNRNGNYDIYSQLIFKDGTLPVELSGFSVTSQSNGKILLNWQTASEKDNAGFEVERRLISDPAASNTFEVVASYLTNTSLLGAGFSNATRKYSFIDQPGKPGIYEYRLADYSLDGERTTHEPKTVEISSASLTTGFSAGQNVPNPFSEKTIIPVTLPQSALVECRVTDILGRIISTPFNSYLESGTHQIILNSSSFGSAQTSGTYFYSVTISDLETGSILWKMPKAMMMVKVTN